MKRFSLVVVCSLLMCLVIKAREAVDGYPKVDEATATFVNHNGEEEQIEIGGSYDAPLTVTFSANPIDTTGFEIRYEWKLEQIKNGVSPDLLTNLFLRFYLLQSDVQCVLRQLPIIPVK